MEKKQSLLILKVIIWNRIVKVIQLNKAAIRVKKAISFPISLSYHMAQSYWHYLKMIYVKTVFSLHAKSITLLDFLHILRG